MSLSYFDDPKKKEAWDKEMNQMRQEKARRMAGKPSKGAESASVSADRAGSEARKENFSSNTRMRITYKQLLEREYGTPKPSQLSRSTARQMEKTKEMGGKNL